MRIIRVGLFVLMCMALPHSQAWTCFFHHPKPVQVHVDDVEIEITDQVMRKTITTTFINPNKTAVVGGTAYMEVEPGATIENVQMTVNDRVVKGEVLGVKSSKQLFVDIIKRGGSPALLEFYGSKLVRTKAPRIPVNGTVTVKLTYTSALKQQDGWIRIHALNTNPKVHRHELARASLRMKITSRRGVRSVYSPTHELRVTRPKTGVTEVSWEKRKYVPRSPFVLYYSPGGDQAVGVDVLTHRVPGQPGYFLATISPGASEKRPPVLPKDIVFCIDTSHSMKDANKLSQSQKALRRCLRELRKGDRFNIVDFSTVARKFSKRLAPLDDDSLARATAYIGRLKADGGTAIAEALGVALEQFGTERDRMKLLVFATDGRPTIGTRETARILSAVAEKNARRKVRIYAVGEGYDVNPELLDPLALDHRGESTYVLPEEDLAERLTRFFKHVSAPVMTDVAVSFGKRKVTGLQPQPVPDLFANSQLILYGRYHESGQHEITLSGMLAGKPHEVRLPIDLPEANHGNPFVAKLWAGQTVNSLLRKMRQTGNTDAMVGRVVSLAERHGIVTPYTTYLVRENFVPGKTAPQVWHQHVGQQVQGAAPHATEAAPQAKKKKQMVVNAMGFFMTRRALSSGRATGLVVDGESADDAAYRKRTLKKLHTIGAKTFYCAAGVWYEGSYTKAARATEILIGSAEYFGLIAEKPDAAAYLSLGQVVFAHAGTWYRILPRK